MSDFGVSIVINSDMPVIRDGLCEFCGKKRKWTSGNMIHGHYCFECLRISRHYDLKYLKTIRTTQKINKQQ